jgi:hypothetical protein
MADSRHSPGAPLQFVNATVPELEPRPDHQIAQRTSDGHIVQSCQSAHSCAECTPIPDVIPTDLALGGGVQPTRTSIPSACAHGAHMPRRSWLRGTYQVALALSRYEHPAI